MDFGLLTLLAALFGLVIGSFLNVVIYRYPILLEQNWRRDCQEYLKLSQDPKKRFNLAWPSSHCPRCKVTLKWWHNIPLLSYVLLRAKCAYCQAQISWQYPAIELITAVLTVVTAWHFGWGWPLLWGLVFTWVMLVLAVIDVQTLLLPDDLVLSLLWIGLLLNMHHFIVPLHQAVLGAVAGYVFLWVVNWLFMQLRNKVGMGHGDFKMLTMLGAWFGIFQLPVILLIAVALSLVVSFTLLALGKVKFQQAIPFGPFLAIAGWAMLVFGPSILVGFAKLLA